MAQQAFLSDQGSTLHLAIPALKTLHKAWFSCSERSKYGYFAPALKVAANKLEEYYNTHHSVLIYNRYTDNIKTLYRLRRASGRPPDST